LQEIIHLVSPGLHNLDVSGYFSPPELSGSPAPGRGHGVPEKAAVAQGWLPPHLRKTAGIWGFPLVPVSQVGRGMRMPSLGSPGGCRAGPGWGARHGGVAGDSGGQRGPSPGTSQQQGHLRSSLPSIFFCHLPVPPAAALSSPRLCHFYRTLAVKIGVK